MLRPRHATAHWPTAFAAPGLVLLLQRQLCHRFRARLRRPSRQISSRCGRPAALCALPTQGVSMKRIVPMLPGVSATALALAAGLPAGAFAAGFDKINTTVTN